MQNDEEISIYKNEVFLLPTRLVASGRDFEEDLSDVSDEEGVIEEADIEHLMNQFYKENTQNTNSSDTKEDELNMKETLYHLADRLGYDIDGRDRPDDVIFDSVYEAARFSPLTVCGAVHEMECIALWDYFGGNNFDDLNVHAGDTVYVVAEEYQVRVLEDLTYMRLPFQWSLGRWLSERTVNPYLGLIPSHYVVSKQFYDENPLLFKWPVWFHGNAEIHEVVHKLYSDRSALCPGLFAIFSPDWLNIDMDEHRCYLLMILKERDKKHDEHLRELIEIERGNYNIMADAINHIFGEMLPENAQKEKSAKMQLIEFLSEIETTPFEPAVVPIHRSSLAHYELMGERYETLYDLVHHLATHVSALPHKLVYCRSSPLVVGRNVVPPPDRKFSKDLRCQPMIIEQWAAAHYNDVTRRFESSEKAYFATKTVFDMDKKYHEKVAGRLNLSQEERILVSSYLQKLKPRDKKEQNAIWDKVPPHETSIRINSPFYVDFSNIVWGTTQLGSGAFGKVNKGYLKRDGKEQVPVAVKLVELVESNRDERNVAFNEMEILEMVAHPNIVFYYGYSLCGTPQQSSLYLLFELMDTSLDKFIDKCDAILSENEKLDLLAQICRGMSFLHTRTPPVVHGDLAARNVLLKKHPVYLKKYIAKITDLGLAKTCRDELHTKYDNPEKIPFKWLPQEVLGSRTLSLKTDVWSFGILCFEVCDKMGEPYGACVSTPNLYQYLNDGYRHEKGQHMSDSIYYIALDCMRKQPVDRPCFDELCHRFLDCILENDGEDEVNVKAREKVVADKNRKARMQKNHGQLVADDM